MTDSTMIVRENSSPYAIMPVLDVQHAAARRQAVIDYTKKMMVENTDYGVIPGTGDKPTLLKPGAEKLASLFGLSPHFDIIERAMDWTGKDHDGEPFFYIQYRCTLYRGDMAIGQGVGSCNSWEKKYRYRTVYPNRATAEDKERGRLETRGGRNGSYQVYVIPNPDPADIVNTIDKMSQKRALVAAVLIAVNASELFTQDVEDYGGIIDGDWQPKPTAAPAPKKPSPTNSTPKQPALQDPADGPMPDDELIVSEAPAKNFINVAAGLLETDADAIKERLHDLGYDRIPGNATARLAAYRKLREEGRGQDVLFVDDPDAEKAASDTAAGLFD